MLHPKTLRSTKIRIAAIIVTLVVLLVLLRLPVTQTFATNRDPASDALTSAWQLAQARGGYHFTGDVMQVTMPEATLINVGRTSREERLYLEGETDLRTENTALRLWSGGTMDGGSALIPASGMEVQVRDGKTQVRRAGGDWQDSPGAVEGYAPQGDFMAYLRAARDVTPHAPEVRQGIAFTRYSFTIDGPIFAAYVRDQMQKALQARGELVSGMRLEVSPYYAKMTGDGELWIDPDGLPLRQVLHLRFPLQRQEQTSAQISVTFHGFGQPLTGWAQVADWAQVDALAQQMPTGLATVALTGLALAAAFSLIVLRRRRVVQNGLAISLILSIVIGPLLSNERNIHFLDVQVARAAEQERQLDARDKVRDVQQMTTESTFDPQSDALAAFDQGEAKPSIQSLLVAQSSETASERGRDSDNDGLSDLEEELVNLNPNLLDSNANGTPDGNEDLDGDGLSNFQEASLGTELRNPDTDGDRRSDLQELQPFTYAGKKWSTDPLEVDTNGDTLADTVESKFDADLNGIPDDTDLDGVPDLFDDDNDGDGVPDRVDLSPFSASGTRSNPYSASKPFALVLNNLQPGQPSFVDLQIRTVITDHLWYAFNVLDWPHDTAGQVQDIDNATYASTVQNVSGPFNPNPPPDLSYPNPPTELTFGDTRLSPMLELRILGNTTHLPAADILLAYNISVIPLTSDGTDTGTIIGKKVYVPLALVSDEQTGARVAFRARMPYLPSSALWGAAHEARLVWTVQVLSDMPCDPLDEQAAAQKCVVGDGSNPFLFVLAPTFQSDLDSLMISAALSATLRSQGVALSKDASLSLDTPGTRWTIHDRPTNSNNPNTFVIKKIGGILNLYQQKIGYVFNVPQVVQTYDDAWYLTGLSVNEDRGVNMALIYEDPAVDSGDLRRDQALWPLVYGLDETFLGGRQDLTIDGLKQRFDHTVNSQVTAAQRWSIPNILRVESAVYDQQDRAVATVTMTRTKEILRDNFSNVWKSSGPVTPTLLFAQEMTYRAMDLDSLRENGPYVVANANGVTIDFAPGGNSPVRVETSRSLKWAAYCAESVADEPAWKECAPDQAANEQAARYAAQIGKPGDTPNMVAGRVGLLQTFFIALARGASAAVTNGGIIPPPSDDALNARIANMVSLGGSDSVAKYVINDLIAGWFSSEKSGLEKVGDKFTKLNDAAGVLLTTKDILQFVNTDLAKLGMGPWKSTIISNLTPLLIGAVLFGFVASKIIWNDPNTEAGARAALWNSIGLLSFSVIATSMAVYKVVEGGMKGLTTFKLASVKAAGYATAVVIAAAWGYFVYSVFANGVAFYSPEFNKAAASMIATTIVLVMLTILSSNPVGALFAALLALVDGILALLCEVKVIEKDEDGDCFSVTGKIIAFYADVIYSYDMMIELDGEKNPDLMRQGFPKLERLNRAQGFIASNPLRISLPVTTTIFHKDPSDWQMTPYLWFYSEDNLRSSTFDYELLATYHPLGDASRGTMKDAWTVTAPSDLTYLGKQLYRGVARSTPSLTMTVAPGINRSLDYHFNSGYEIPAYECWTTPTLPPIPVCYKRDKDGSSSSPVKGPKLDIFPNTLDEFVAVEADGNGGYRLNWDKRFPTLFDSDGDGLVVSAKGGIDPNDRKADSDEDGLPDRFELDRRLDGVAYGPGTWDTDLDGLTDAQEAALGSNPNNADSDNDGLLDGEEVYHRVLLPYDTDQWTGGWDVVSVPWSDPSTVTTRTPITNSTLSSKALTVHISSDPTSADPDGDGIPDDVERTWATSPNLWERIDEHGRPFHPLVFNINPLQVYVASTLVGGFIGRNQSFLYTSTVAALQNFAPGVLEVTTPAQLGGFPHAYRFDLSAGMSVTLPTQLTVAANASSGAIKLTSTARARTPDKAAADSVVWSASSEAPIGPSGGPSAVDVTPNRPDRADMYLFPGLVSDTTNRGGRGDVFVYTRGGMDQEKALDVDNGNLTYLRSSAAPSSACNNNSQCLTVWDHVDNCNYVNISYLYVANEGLDGTPGVEPLIFWHYNPGSAAPPANPINGATDWSEVLFQTDVQNIRTGGSITWPTPIRRYYCDPSPAYDARLIMGEADVGTAELVGFANLDPAKMPEIDNDVNKGPSGVGFGPNGNSVQINLSVAHDLKQRNTIAGSIVSVSGDGAINTTLAQFPILYTGDTARRGFAEFNPTLASNGNTFLMAWNIKTVTLNRAIGWDISSFVVARSVSAAGVVGDNQVLDSANCVVALGADAADNPINFDKAFARTETDMIPTVVWAGDRYRVVWNQPTCADSTGSLWSADLNRAGDGRVAGTSNRYLNSGTDGASITSTGINRRNPAQIAYDPTNQRTLLVYRTNTGVILGSLFDSTTNPVQHFTLVNQNNATPSIAWHPGSNGWLLTWRDYLGKISFASLPANLTSGIPALANQAISTPGYQTSTPSLACPSPLSAPVMALPFEEMPGDSQFVNVVTGQTNAGTCSGGTCPTVGVGGVGVLGAGIVVPAIPPRSDRALYFDGVDDSVGLIPPVQNDFTYAFWFKADPTQSHSGQFWWEGTPLLATSASYFDNGYGVALGNDNRILYGVGTQSMSSGPVTLGQWHHVVITRRATTGDMALYVDAQAPVTNNGSDALLASGPQLYFGGFNALHYRGAIDYLTVHATALAVDAVAALYKGELKADLGYTANPSYCVVSAATTNGFAWSRISGKKALKRGDGPVVNSANLLLTVDATPPTSTLDSLAGQLVTGPLTAGKYLNAPNPLGPGSDSEMRVIGGNAYDAESGVDHVDVTINGLSVRANGRETWAAPLTIKEGTYAIQSLAVDGVGNPESNGPTLNFTADGTPPDLSVTIPAQYLLPMRAASGKWAVQLSGTAQDGGQIYSELDAGSLEVLMQASDGSFGDWQPATWQSNDSTWKLLYELPDLLGSPTGIFTVTVRGADIVGNQRESKALLSVRSLEMKSATCLADARLNPIANPLTLTGILTSSADIVSTEALFTPIEQIVALSDTVMILPFDEPAGSLWFDNPALPSNGAHCALFTGCPTAGEAGRNDRALTFNNGDSLRVEHAPLMDFKADESFTLQGWIKATKVDAILMLKNGIDGVGYNLSLDANGRLYLELNGVRVVESQASMVDNTWHHVAVVVDRTRETILYIDGTEDDYDPTGAFSASVANESPVEIGYGFAGLIDDLMISRRALKADEVHAIIASGDRTRYPVTLSPMPGSPSAKEWQISVPAGLESFYQIDLRVTDERGNQRLLDSVWRGVIDTLAPRLTIEDNVTGQIFDDASTGAPRYDVGYTIRAEDMHLDSETFASLCKGQVQPERTYINDSWVNTIFPDMTLRNVLTLKCHNWATQADPQTQASVCDGFGHCTIVNHTALTTGVVQASAVDGKPVIVWPPAGSVIVVTDTLQVQMAMNSSTPLRQIGVMNMATGQPIKMIEIAQQDQVKRTLQTITIDLKDANGNWVLPENSYNLGVSVRDWGMADGDASIVGDAFNFAWDTADPEGSLIGDVLVEADSYAVTSGMMRFHGVASDSSGAAKGADGEDSMGLATVQVQVGSGPFMDATLRKNGATDWEWSTALYVGADPFGKSFPITVKTIDRGGRMTTTSKSVVVNIQPPVGYTSSPLPIAPVQLTINDISRGEGEGVALFTVALSQPVNQALEVSFSSADGSASQPSDYTASMGKVTIAAGATSASISVPIVDDQSAEGNESFSINLTLANRCAAANIAIADGQGVVTITDNDAGTNGVPTAGNDSATTTSGAPVTIIVLSNDADPNGDTLTVSIASQPSHGTATVNGGQIIYTPSAGFVGSDSFTYSISDGKGGVATAIVTVTVTDGAAVNRSVYLPVIGR